MDSLEQIRTLADRIAQFELVQCDIRHEALMTTEDGLSAERPFMLLLECPQSVANRRPACPHQCTEASDAMPALAYALQPHVDDFGELQQLLNQYAVDTIRKGELDNLIRHERTSLSILMNEYCGSVEIIEGNTEPLIAEHRAIVSRMRHFKDKLLDAATTVLALSHPKKAN